MNALALEREAAASPVFRAEGITKVYRMGEVEVHALRGIDLELPEGELMVLLGPSGSGKSTLLNILGGLDVPTAGRVLYRGEDLTRADESRLTEFRRVHVGFVFQFYNLIPSLTARENVELVTEITERPMDPAEALALVDLQDRMDHFLRFVKGGHSDKVLASADANCSPLGWPGVKGHTVNYIFEVLIPDLRHNGVDEDTITRIFVDNPADFLSIRS